MNMSNYKRYFKNSLNPVFITFVTYNRREILIPNIEALIKFNFSINVSEKFICQNLSDSAIKSGEKGIWQRRYYDHIIRN